MSSSSDSSKNSEIVEINVLPKFSPHALFVCSILEKIRETAEDLNSYSRLSDLQLPS